MKALEAKILDHLLNDCFQDEPEADLNNVARGDFAGLQDPIIIAAATQEQFDEFVFMNGLVCSQVRRFCDYQDYRTAPMNKILILLPFHYDHEPTAAAVASAQLFAKGTHRRGEDAAGPRRQARRAGGGARREQHRSRLRAERSGADRRTCYGCQSARCKRSWSGWWSGSAPPCRITAGWRLTTPRPSG
jgi:hypothetical protein